MRPRVALALALSMSLVPCAIPAQSATLCGGAEALALDTGRVRGGLSASIALSDLDGDGTLEILSGDSLGSVHIWKADGSRFKQWPKRAGSGTSPIFGSPSVGDIDGDGRPDVVVASYSNVAVYAWRATGGLVRGFPKRIGVSESPGRIPQWVNDSESGFLRGAVMLADLNEDELPDVVAGASYGLIHAFADPFGQQVPGWPVHAGSNFQVTPVSSDLDGDGSPEVVLHGVGVRVVRADGTLFPGWPRFPGLSHATPVLGDLDGDDTPEVIVAADSTLIAYRANGTMLFAVSILNDYFYYSSIALGDVTGDGLPEIFIGTQQGAIYGFAGNGGILPGWPIDTGEDLDTSPLIVDLDGDGARDVLVLAADATLHALGADGSEICPPVALGALAIASPAVGDLDGDGFGEVIAPTYGGGAFILGLPGPWTPSRAAWPMHLANERHTGDLP